MRFLLLLLLGTLLLFGGVDKSLKYPTTTKIEANEIAKQIYFVNHQFYLDNQIIKATKKNSFMIVRRFKDRKVRVFRADRYLNNDYSDGVTKSKELIVFKSGNLKGTGVLAREFVDETKSLEIFMWLPALRKVRRMAEPSKNIGFSAADIAFLEEAKLRRLQEDRYELLEKRVINFKFAQIKLKASELNRFTKLLPTKENTLETEVYVLKATPKEDAWYDYRVDYVDTKHFTVHRTKYYVNKKLIKIIDRQWHKVEGINDKRAYMWRYWYSLNPQSKLETANYLPKEIINCNDDKIKSSFWSKRTLSKIKK